MQIEKVEKWIDALESGNFKKTEGVLKDCEGGYCCLGVLCHIFKDEIEENTNDKIIETNGRDSELFASEHVALAIETHSTFSRTGRILEETGLTLEISDYFGLNDDLLNKLMNANDESEKKDFSEVVPVIREQLLQKTEEGKSE